jgi:hypothetical protein
VFAIAMIFARLVRFGLSLFVLLMVCGATHAQTGEIRGAVSDVTGAVLPGATVIANLSATNAHHSTITNGDGEFAFADLPVGTYMVSVNAAGFAENDAANVDVQIGHVTRLDVSLGLGTQTESVLVRADSALVETQSTQLGGVMSQTAIRELPLSTRDTYQLLQLQPGVQSQLGADLFYGSDNPGVVSVNGGRGRSNNYMVNGGDGNDLFVNGPAVEPSPDTVQEFRVFTSAFDAEFGRDSGSIVNVVTKSGTNEVHGDAYEFFRTRAFDARGYFDPVVPDDHQNQFGATLGGPLRKDRTFFFGSYEGGRLIQGISSGGVVLPTQSEAAGDFSEAGSAPFTGTLLNPAFAHVLATRQTSRNAQDCQATVEAEGGPAFDPLPSAGIPYWQLFPGNRIPIACFDPTALALYGLYVAPSGTGPISSVPLRHDRHDQLTQKFDHRISASQQLSLYYFFDDDNRADPFANFEASGANLPGFGSVFRTRVQQWSANHQWTVGAAGVSEFHFNLFRESQGRFWPSAIFIAQRTRFVRCLGDIDLLHGPVESERGHYVVCPRPPGRSVCERFRRLLHREQLHRRDSASRQHISTDGFIRSHGGLAHIQSGRRLSPPRAQSILLLQPEWRLLHIQQRESLRGGKLESASPR